MQPSATWTPGRGKDRIRRVPWRRKGEIASSEVAKTHPKVESQLMKSMLQRGLAERLLDTWEAENTPKSSWVIAGGHLIDIETGEILEAEPGEHPERFLAVLELVGADPKNHWIGYRRGSDNRGEPDAVPLAGAAWSPSTRIDPNYQARGKTRARREIMNDLAIAWAKLRKKRLLVREWKELFLTFTYPNRQYLDELAEMGFCNRALARMREHQFWRERVFGGVKTLENPGGQTEVETHGADYTGGNHVHSHQIAISRYLPQTALAWLWTGSVVEQRAFEGDPVENDPRATWIAKGWTLEIIIELEDETSTLKRKLKNARTASEQELIQANLNTVQGLLREVRRDLFIVDVRLVRDRATGEHTISRDGSRGAIDEVAKYVTKTTDLMKRDPRELVAITMPNRAPRVFDPYGECRERKGEDSGESLDAKIKAALEARGVPVALLDTTAINSGGDAGSEHTDPPKEGENGKKATPKIPPKRRPPGWRVLHQHLNLDEFIQEIQRRAARGRNFAFQRLKTAGIMAWSLAEALDFDTMPELDS